MREGERKGQTEREEEREGEEGREREKSRAPQSAAGRDHGGSDRASLYTSRSAIDPPSRSVSLSTGLDFIYWISYFCLFGKKGLLRSMGTPHGIRLSLC